MNLLRHEDSFRVYCWDKAYGIFWDFFISVQLFEALVRTRERDRSKEKALRDSERGRAAGVAWEAYKRGERWCEISKKELRQTRP